MNRNILLLFVLLLFIASCEDRSNLVEPEPVNIGDADFSKFISIGNSLTAGMQNGALYQSAQNYSFSNLIARQAGIDFVQPTIDDPGLGGRIDIESLDPFSTFIHPIAGGFPNNSDYDSIYNNLGIPGALLSDILYAKNSLSSSDNSNLFFDVVLRERGSVIEQVISYQPTLLTLWIGNNDILGYATSGGTTTHTNVDSFAVLFEELCSELYENEIQVVMANIPDVRTIPFFSTIGPKIGKTLEEMKNNIPQLSGLFYESSESPYYNFVSIDQLLNNTILITLTGSDLGQYIGNTDGDFYSDKNISVPQNVDVSLPFGLSMENPIPNYMVIDASEQIIIENVTSSFNATISSNALNYDFNLVDINGFFNNIANNGYQSDGINFTTEFIFGGLFSLDGIHPTHQGYGIIANKFIEVINDEFNAEIPYINISTLPGSINIIDNSEISKIQLHKFNGQIFESIFY